MSERCLPPPPRVWVVIDTDPVSRGDQYGYPTKAQPAEREEDLAYYNPGLLTYEEMKAVPYIVDPSWAGYPTTKERG